ncbi:unnamed protein product [Thlaspi arvense]|uniref:Uncharacterized protein n=1 Tax=Thlaspi arvense TaxID=13288 RepID=A0AAU9T197_THLAR|nr:unnamed protein product [Thlaspi arvense]
MNGQEGDDNYDVFDHILNPSFVGIADDDGSDANVGALSGNDDQDGGTSRGAVRRAPQQIEELEKFFKECPKPSQEQKSELGRRLNMEINKVKFWFQNRRAQEKVYENIEHHHRCVTFRTHESRRENHALKAEQDKLRREHEQLKQAVKHYSCSIYGGTEISRVVQQRIEESAGVLKQQREMAKSLLTSPVQWPVSPSPAQASSPLMVSNPESDALQEQNKHSDHSGEASTIDTLFVSSSTPPHSPSLMVYNPESNAPPDFDFNDETLNEISAFLASSSAAHASSSLMFSDQGRNAPLGVDSGSDMTDMSTAFVSPSAAPSPSLMVSTQGRNAPLGVNPGSDMSDRSTAFVSPSAVPSPSLMDSTQGRNAPQGLHFSGETLNERSNYFGSSSASHASSSSLMFSDQGRNTPLGVNSGTDMNDSSTAFVSPSAAPSPSLMVSHHGRNAPQELHFSGETLNERSNVFGSSSASHASSYSLIFSDQGRNAPQELHFSGETLNERSNVFGSSSASHASSYSLIFSDQGRNAPLGVNSGSDMNDWSTAFVSSSAAPSSSLMVSHQGRNAPQELHFSGETLNESSNFFGSSSAAHASSSLMFSNQWRNAPLGVNSGNDMNDRSTAFVSSSAVSSPSLMVSTQGRNAPQGLHFSGETLNERSTFLGSSSAAYASYPLMFSDQWRNAPLGVNSGNDMNDKSTAFVSTSALSSSSLMASHQGRNASQGLDFSGETLNERSYYFGSSSAAHASSSLMFSDQGRNAPLGVNPGSDMNDRSTYFVSPSAAPSSSTQGRNAQQELHVSGETLNERSTFLGSSSAAYASYPLMFYDQGRNAPLGVNSGSGMNDMSTAFFSPSAAPSPSLMVSTQERNAPQGLYFSAETLNERSTFFGSSSAAHASSSLMFSDQGRNAPLGVNSGSDMNDRSTAFVTPSAAPSPSLMASTQGRNAKQELNVSDETLNQRSNVLGSSAAAYASYSVMFYDQGRNAPLAVNSGTDRSTAFVSPSAVSSPSLMVSTQGRNAPLGVNPGRNAPQEPHFSAGKKFTTTFFDSSSAAHASSSLLVSDPGSQMNDRSTDFVSPSAAPSPSLMVSDQGMNAPPKPFSGGETGAMNDDSVLEYATAAMNQLVMMAETNSPFWRRDSRTKRDKLNYDEYKRYFGDGLKKPPRFVMEASRETGTVLMDRLALVKTLTTEKWVNVFAPIVSVAAIKKLTPTGFSGPSGSLRLIEADFQVISPLVPNRHVKFIRYCNMLREGLWVVVDVTPRHENLNLRFDRGPSRLPSGLIIQDLTNGSCKVTWIELAEYNENRIPQLYHKVIGSGIGLGAKRWLTTLQRYCENVFTLSSINVAQVYQGGLSANVATEIVKLANRMTLNYYSGITGSLARRWKRINVEGEGHQDVRLMTRRNVGARGEYTGKVLNAATSVWFPVNKQTMFDYLNNESLRGQWDVMTKDGSIENEIKIPKSRRQGNCVSLLKVLFAKQWQGGGMSVLQETWNDESGALLVYAPMELASVEEIMSGKAFDAAKILPSGFHILPDGRESGTGGGCLVTLGFQFLVNSKPTEEVAQGFVGFIEERVATTLAKIKSALDVQT